MGQSVILTLSQAEWDRALSHFSNPHPFAFSWVLNALCPGSWIPMMDSDSGALLALPVRKLGPFPVISRQPFFLRTCGIHTEQPVNEAQVMRFWKALPPGLWKLHVYWNQPVPGKTTRTRIHQALDLNSDFSYKGNVRRNLKKAQSQDLKSFTPSARETDEAFFAHRGKDMAQLHGAPRQRMRQLMLEAENRHAAVYWGFKDHHEQLHAAGFFIRTGRTLLFVHGGATEAGKKSGAMYLVMDQAVQYGREQGLAVLDFGGSNVQGVADFYRGFGAEDQTYYEIQARWPLSI